MPMVPVYLYHACCALISAVRPVSARMCEGVATRRFTILYSQISMKQRVLLQHLINSDVHAKEVVHDKETWIRRVAVSVELVVVISGYWFICA